MIWLNFEEWRAIGCCQWYLKRWMILGYWTPVVFMRRKSGKEHPVNLAPPVPPEDRKWSDEDIAVLVARNEPARPPHRLPPYRKYVSPAPKEKE